MEKLSLTSNAETRTISPRATRQSPINEILQSYRVKQQDFFQMKDSQNPIQRTEADAVKLARRYDGTRVYNSWEDIEKARKDNVKIICSNWEKLADAYIQKGKKMGDADIVKRATELLDAKYDWKEIQIRKEASEVIQGLSLMLPKSSSGYNYINPLYDQLKTKYLMTCRYPKSSPNEVTSLDLPQDKTLELFNKKHPETGQSANLGTGGFGYGRFGRIDGNTVFVKKMVMRREVGVSADHIYKRPIELQESWREDIGAQIEAVKHELDIGVLLGAEGGHPNVIRTYGGGFGYSSKGIPKAYVAMEMGSGTDVSDIIKSQQQKEVNYLRRAVNGMLEGLAYIHRRGILHRDIKPENIMISSSGDVKYIDFGSAIQAVDGVYRTKELVGTREYLAPELLGAKKGEDLVYNEYTDIFALGLVIYKLLTETQFDVGQLGNWLASFVNTKTTVADLQGTLPDILKKDDSQPT